MNFTLHQLEIFRRIVELESVTRAAASLHLSQPAVSTQLRNLQAQFDVPLTEVVGRRIHVTDFGRAIAEAAEAIAAEVEQVDGLVAAYKGLLVGRLRIAIVSTGQYVMPSFLADFMHAHGKVTVQMDVTNKAQVLKSLETGRIDFALVSILPEHIPVEAVPLLPNELYLVGEPTRIAVDFGPEAPAARAVALDPGVCYTREIFRELPLILREQGSGTRLTMEAFLTAHAIPVTTRMELTSHEAVKQAVLAGLGYSIMPLIGIRERLDNGSLRILPVAGLPVRSEWNLIWPAGKRHSPAARAYLALVHAERERIVRERFPWVAPDKLDPVVDVLA